MFERAFAGLPVGQDWLAKAASCERLCPAHIARAARVLELVAAQGSDPASVEADLDRIVGNSLSAAGAAWPRGLVPRSPTRYNLGLLNTDVDLGTLVRGLQEGEPGARICLYGPPGTGKSALARHLAETLGRPLLAKKMSDLLLPYLGQTEALVAEMFAEAAERGAVLLLDEADGLLRDRRGASRR
jgi:midasin (ATPase involved in ribosome maturation)